MARQYKQLTQRHIEFIKQQRLFYLASASNAEVNLSPKGFDSLRVLDEKTFLFMNYSGSGNRTHRDISNKGEFTLLFNAFDGNPKIIRVFCKARIIDKSHPEFKQSLKMFNERIEFIKNFYEFNVYAVEISCGYTVPVMEFKETRKHLHNWMNNFHEKGRLEKYNLDNFDPPDLRNMFKKKVSKVK